MQGRDRGKSFLNSASDVIFHLEIMVLVMSGGRYRDGGKLRIITKINK